MVLTLEKTPVKIKERVVRRLRDDDRINAERITVTVDGTTVRLEGTVWSLGDRRLAEADAAVIPGVRIVDNRLSVRLSEEHRRRDSDIHDAIRNALTWNSSIDASQVSVIIRDGIVRLEGFVPNYWQKMKTQAIAENITGVVDVDNLLRIARLREYSDDLIREEVIAELARNLPNDAPTIDVHVNNGVVTLDGNVNDLSAFRGAESIAYNVNGVVIVINDLVIELSSYKP